MGIQTKTITQHADYYEAREFPELYAEFSDRINRYLRSRVYNPWDADDLTTAVFLKALEKFHQYSRHNPFSGWIFRIAHTTFIDFVRKKREALTDNEEIFHSEVDNTWQPEEQALASAAFDQLKEKLDLLTPDQRDVLTLRYFADMKVSQVADVLGKKESNVKTIAYRGLQELKKLYQQEKERL